MSKTASGLPKSLVMRAEVVEDTALTHVPTPGRVVPSGWWQEYATQVAAVEDTGQVLEDVKKLAALAKYVKDRAQRFEVDAARIIGETRIGELLEPEVGGRGRKVSTGGEVSMQDRVRFRKLAAHRDLVLRLLVDGVASRKRILAKIEALGIERPELAGVELRHGDFREVLGDLAGTVDAIITDPPYPREFLPLYEDLSEVAERILRPGGILAAMVGHAYLPDVLLNLREHLDYRWTMAYLTGGAAASVHARRVQVYWKPIVVFEKPPTDINHRIGGDVIRAGGNDRDDTEHYWGQTESGMAQIVERLTAPGALVVDPFAGGGTTLVVCSALGRSCVGAEIDDAAVQRAQERIGAGSV